jgi:hypothetical protein
MRSNFLLSEISVWGEKIENQVDKKGKIQALVNYDPFLSFLFNKCNSIWNYSCSEHHQSQNIHIKYNLSFIVLVNDTFLVVTLWILSIKLIEIFKNTMIFPNTIKIFIFNFQHTFLQLRISALIDNLN